MTEELAMERQGAMKPEVLLAETRWLRALAIDLLGAPKA